MEVTGWLGLRGLSRVVRDPQNYPAWNDALAAAMAEETNRFVDGLIADGKPLNDLVSASHGFVNDALAALYGVAPPAKADTAS